jgi:hypothetical protein
MHNPNCDGSHCRAEIGEVRLYPLGEGANLILCSACWAHENTYRITRGRETGTSEKWPPLKWSTAKVYATLAS